MSETRRAEHALLAASERIWRHLPDRARDLRPVRAYGGRMHALVRHRADREMYLGTFFLRNRPALALMRRLVRKRDAGSTIRVAVLGCSVGVEVYSIVWTLRGERPDLKLSVHAIDISPEAVRVGERGLYGSYAVGLAGWPVFQGMTDAEREAMFDWDGETAGIKPWLRAGISWRVADACDPNLVAQLGPQDIVVANNFLCHMDPGSAEHCLRNVGRLVVPGGHLFVTGVDLDVRTQVARELGWKPVPDLREQIHDGDRLVRADWPWRWWGLEPLDRRRADWETRYSAVFMVPG